MYSHKTRLNIVKCQKDIMTVYKCVLVHRFYEYNIIMLYPNQLNNAPTMSPIKIFMRHRHTLKYMPERSCWPRPVLNRPWLIMLFFHLLLFLTRVPPIILIKIRSFSDYSLIISKKCDVTKLRRRNKQVTQDIIIIMILILSRWLELIHNISKLGP